MKTFAALDEFNMYFKGTSRPRKADFHLAKSQFNVDSFKLTDADRILLMVPSFDTDMKEIPFVKPLPITPNPKQNGTRIDFGITAIPGYGTEFKCFGEFRPDGRYKKSSTAPIVFDQKKGISHKQFIEWLTDISEFQVFYIFIYFLFIFYLFILFIYYILFLINFYIKN
jgi:hypothetical protein